MCWRAGDPWAPLNYQDPLFRLTSLHLRQTGGSIGGVLPLCRTAAGEFYPPSGWGAKKKKVFEKGYTTRWTEEIFTIKKIRDTDPITYKLEDLQGEEIKGSFYEPELQKTAQQIYRIEKIIKKEKGKSLVKWKGYSDKFNSWVDNKDLIELKKR